jgi:periplasmic protein TonB
MRQGFRLIDTALKPKPNPLPAPTLLVQLEPWHRVFFRNLRDALWPRRPAELQLSSPPADFWQDVFVRSRLPWLRFAESAILHTAVIAMLWGSARLWPQRVHVITPVAFHSSDVIYYQASDLPPLDTGGAKPRVAAKGDPAYSPQPIISVPPDADNRRQTIVTPPKLKLDHDVPLPNVVAWNRPQPAIPLAAAKRRTSDEKLPALSTTVIAPPPEVNPDKLNKAPILTESAVAPAPDIDSTVSRQALPVPQTAVVAPPPGIELASVHKLSDINIGHAKVVAPAPQLPVEEQRALGSRAQGSLGYPTTAVVPPPPSVQGAGANQEGRLIALNLQPASPTAPVEVPQGNRRGTFAATPQGKPGASGTPDTAVANNRDSGGTDRGKGHGDGAGSGHSANGVPPGLFVGAGTAGDSLSAAIAGSRNGSATAGDPPLMASATPPRPGSMPRRPALEMSPDQQTDVERKVFANRKSYAMTLNLPNLNSAGGSWVMHFSELQDEKQSGNLVAPVATRTVDPGYPLELMRENVRGTVTLSAVIRSDGSVGEVQVLNGIDDRLDAYARNALANWRFLPALRNGNPVALQAVVIIPFRPRQKVGF